MKILTVGEYLMRLSAPSGTGLAGAEELSVCFGGGEANVAAALAGFGAETSFLSALPENAVGEAALRDLRRFGIDVSFILRKRGRLGLYFYEAGASLRAGKVVYDRAGSVFAETAAAEYDLCGALQNADALVLSGITPALGKNTEELALRAVKTAKERGVKVFFDVNFRSALWSMEEAGKVFRAILPHTDVCIASSDGLDVLGGKNAGADKAACERAARRMKEEYGLGAVALTVRESPSASKNVLSGVLVSDKTYFSASYPVDILERVGGGDAFTAGLVFSLMRGADGQTAVDFAAASDAYKHTLRGDKMCVPAEEIEAAMRGDTRIRR